MKWRREDLIAIHNNIARRKGLPQLSNDKRLTANQIADRIEYVNSYRPRSIWRLLFWHRKIRQ